MNGYKRRIMILMADDDPDDRLLAKDEPEPHRPIGEMKPIY